MVSIKFWYIKYYGVGVGDDFVAKKTTTILKVPSGYSKYSYFSKA